ncbi:Cytochrome p450 [Thalictrum thalictroides]|uniref:Cytochrome p450 n=1 Tax=Thalictrum thalictroides TaxID=46969 RepID=A0A7J6VFR9_THATH|nr:Cytochrome p450 [Thalictrum thalictroides]
MSELFSSRRLSLLKHVPDSEIKASIKQLYMLCVNYNKNGPVPIEMKQWFGDLTLNVILRMIVGKRYFGAVSDNDESESRRCQKAMREFMKLLGVFIVDDAVPYFRWLDLQGYKKKMRNISKELDCFFQGWLEEKQRKRLSGDAKEEQDFMDVLMSKLEHTKISDYDNDTIIKSACLSIISGGDDTTMLTLTWILSLLLNNKQVLKKAQEELDNHVGRDRHVDESDIKNLVYLQAIIKEALRIYPPGPLSGPRLATEDCTVAGYHVPAGTRLVVNLWKIQRDPLVWSDPSEFLPERFLTDHVEMDVKGQHYELIPFGAGRRACPGTAFALQVMPLVMASLLHGFEVTTPMDMPVDMTETAGLTNVKATPLDVIITPRLRPELYGL